MDIIIRVVVVIFSFSSSECYETIAFLLCVSVITVVWYKFELKQPIDVNSIVEYNAEKTKRSNSIMDNEIHLHE